MKKFLVSIIFIFFLFLFSGCNLNKTDPIKNFKNKLKKINCYQINGTLEVINNEAVYKYDINISSEKEKYLVSLKNKTNDHEQIILKNESGVYVLTPSLNKSFKFQSDWPYNNSQSYLLQSILNDVENDSNLNIKNTTNGYVINSKVNYTNNTGLKNQKIYTDKKFNIKKVEVYDENGIVKIKMKYDNVSYKKCFNKNYFDLDNNMKTVDKSKEASKIENIVYPLYIPENTKLDSQDTINTDNKERVILSFKGDKPFTIFEEPVNTTVENTIVESVGDFGFINDVIGTITEDSVSWVSNGIEYYAVSNSLNTNELLEVVNSVTLLPVGK